MDLLGGENAEKIAGIINAANAISGDKPAPGQIQKIEPQPKKDIAQ